MTPEGPRDRLADLALGLLDPTEAEELLEATVANGAWRAEAGMYAQAAEALVLSAPPIPLPLEVLERITANVATTEIFGLDRGFDEMKRIWDVVPAHHKKIHEALVLVGKPRLRKKILSKDFVAGKLSEDLEASKVWLQRTCDDVLNEARATIRRNQERGKGSFLFLNLMETHFPYHIAPTFETLSEGIWGKLREIVSLYHLVNQTWLIKGESPIRQDMLDLLRDRQRKAWELLAPTVDEFVREMHEGGDNLVVFDLTEIAVELAHPTKVCFDVQTDQRITEGTHARHSVW